jgi:hypothetical protein
VDTAVASELARYLAKFERLVEPGREARVAEAYRRVFAWEAPAALPFVWEDWGDAPPAPDPDWPEYPYNDAFYDPGMMLLNQLRDPFLHYQLGDDQPLAIRAHYGTVILPSVFGGAYQLTETSLPWAHPLAGGSDAIRALLERGVPDLLAGLGARCFETAAHYRETLRAYPALAEAVRIYHPDLQGPFDVAHLLWGPGILIALYDEPELVHALLDLVTETYIAWLRRWQARFGENTALTAHWNIMMRGGAMVRDDTAVMLSPAHYREFVRPYDQRILDAFGGCIHFCGRGAAFVGDMVESRNLYGLHISQPELNDMDTVWRLCQERRLVLLALPEEYVHPGTDTGVTLRRSWRSLRGLA